MHISTHITGKAEPFVWTKKKVRKRLSPVKGRRITLTSEIPGTRVHVLSSAEVILACEGPHEDAFFRGSGHLGWYDAVIGRDRS